MVFFLNCHLAHADVVIHKIVFKCKTIKHLVLIDTQSAELYRYRAWNLPKNINSKPDIEVMNGQMQLEGTGVCGSRYFTFKTGNVEFNIDDNVACDETHPPKGAVGELEVVVSGKEKNHYYCF